MNDAITDAIGRVIAEHISEINTMAPGVIVSYNPGNNRAVVRLSLPKRLADGTDLAAPQIVSVPVKWPGGNSGSMTFPLQAGDPCEVRFSQRSLDNWLSGSPGSADDPRSFDLSDAICDPGLAPVGITGDQTGVVLRYKNVSLKLSENSITLTTPGGTVSLGLDGILTASQDVKAGTISLKNHVHTGVTAGAANSGVPLP